MQRLTSSSTRALLAVAVGLSAIASTETASAGEYSVWTCRAPDGSPAPAHGASGGWVTESFSGNPNGGNVAAERCASGGTISLRIAGLLPQPFPSAQRWRFVAPSGTSVSSYELDFAGYARPRHDGAPTYGDLFLVNSRQIDPDYDERFYAAGQIPRRVTRHDGADTSWIAVQGSCSGWQASGHSCDPGADGGVVTFDIYRGTFRLKDADAPRITSVSGDAVALPQWVGAAGLAVSADDAGSGVYRLGVEVDGQVRSWQHLADAPCRAWPGTERHFLAAKPCPSSVGGSQSISTADLPEGAHTVRVFVEDAAGNRTTAYGPATKTITHEATTGTPGSPTGTGDNAGDLGNSTPNGSPAVSDARLRARWDGRESDQRSVRYNARPTLSGQLTTASGQPIRDAFIRVNIKRDARNSPEFERDSLRTNADGRFRWRLPAGVSSQAIRLSYHQFVRDTKPVASRTLRLKVSAGVRLTLSRKAARRGQSVKLRGRLLGRPLPSIGKTIELQARNRGGKWITFRTVRSKKSGAFAATYRFRRPGPAKFQMRARVRRSGDYPYTTGSSPARTIKVR